MPVTIQEKALSFLYRELRAAKIALGQAEGRKGVTPEELLNLENRIEAIDWLIPLVLKEEW